MTLDYFLHFVTPFGLSMFIALALIPLWITICRRWKLFDEPDSRKHHARNIPSMGGIALFAGISISFLVFADIKDHDQFRYLFGATIILFFTGFFDDLMTVPMINKLLIQTASAMIVYHGGFRIEHLGGILWVNEVPEMIQFPLTIFFIVAFTNAFNFIDGTDGLAGMLGTVIATGLGVIFLLTGAIDYAVLCFCLTGALFGFLFFNFAPARIFMGDTGSLVTGFVLASCAVQALSASYLVQDLFHVPALLFALLVVPLYDITRVFIVRMTKGSSPFLADRSHLHHILLRHNFGHRFVAFMISGLTMLIVAMSLAVPLIPLNVFILLATLTILIVTSNEVMTVFSRYYHQMRGNSLAHEKQSDSGIS